MLGTLDQPRERFTVVWKLTQQFDCEPCQSLQIRPSLGRASITPLHTSLAQVSLISLPQLNDSLSCSSPNQCSVLGLFLLKFKASPTMLLYIYINLSPSMLFKFPPRKRQQQQQPPWLREEQAVQAQPHTALCKTPPPGLWQPFASSSSSPAYSLST